MTPVLCSALQKIDAVGWARSHHLPVPSIDFSLDEALALSAAISAAPDENALPMELLPERCRFSYLDVVGVTFEVCLITSQNIVELGVGLTPRAAFLAAIEAARHE